VITTDVKNAGMSSLSTVRREVATRSVTPPRVSYAHTRGGSPVETVRRMTPFFESPVA